MCINLAPPMIWDFALMEMHAKRNIFQESFVMITDMDFVRKVPNVTKLTLNYLINLILYLVNNISVL